MKTIYIIIVTYNGMKWIEKCLNSIRNSTYPVTTIVVDNGSVDGTYQYIKEYYKEVLLYNVKQNIGFGQANNIGIKYAIENNADYVFLLNQDAYIYSDMFAKMLYVSEKYIDGGVFAPLHVNGTGLKLDCNYKKYINRVAPDILEDILCGVINDAYQVKSVPAAGWLIPIKTIHEIGGFDPIFFHYGEDEQFAQRVRYHNMCVYIIPSAKMIHDREIYGNIVAFKKGSFLRSIETYIFLDINNSFSYCICLFFSKYWASFRGLFHEIKSRNWALIKEQFSSFFIVLFRLQRYRIDRTVNKSKGCHWLNSVIIRDAVKSMK